MAFEAGTVVARLRLVATDFASGIKKAESQTADLRAGLDRISGTFGKLAAVSGAAFAAISASLGLAARTGAKFEESMVNVGAVTGAAGDALNELSGIAVEMGETTIFSASQVAEAMFALGSSGISAAQDFRNILTPALDLAAASQADIGLATDAVLTALAGFGLGLNQATRVADVFSAANETSRLNLVNLSNAMPLVAATADGLGISIEDTTSVLAGLAEAGIKGQRAGTALKVSLGLLAKATGPAAKILEKLGFSQGRINKLLPTPIKLFKELGKAGLTAAQSLKIFGLEGGPAVLAITKQLPKIEAVRKELGERVGSAARIAAVQLAATAAKFKLLGSAVESVSIAIFDTLQPAINAAIRVATDIAKTIADWIRKNKDLALGLVTAALAVTGIVAAISSIIAIAAAAGVGVLGLKIAFAGLGGVLPGVTKKLAAARIGMGKLAGKAGVAGLAFSLGFVLGKVIDDFIRKRMPELSDALDTIAEKVVNVFVKTGGASETFADKTKATETALNAIKEASARSASSTFEYKQRLDDVNEAIRVYNASLGSGVLKTLEFLQTVSEGPAVILELEKRLESLAVKTKAVAAEGLSREEMEAEAALQQAFIARELEFIDQRIAGGTVILSKKDQENEKQESLIEKIGRAVNLEGKFGTAIEGVLAGTRGVSESLGELVKGIGKAIVKAVILQVIMLAIKGIFGGGFIGKLLGFSGGGIVGAQRGLLPPGEDMLVGVTRGEAILTPQAVQAIGGAPGVAALNQGQAAGPSQVFNVTIEAPFGITQDQIERFADMASQARLNFAGGT